MADEFQVLSVEAILGEDSRFLLVKSGQTDSNKPITATSSSIEIQGALLSAFLSRARPPILFEEQTTVIRRVMAFAAGDPPYLPPKLPGDHLVARIATQRNPEHVHHLEVFLAKIGEEKETAFNVYDPLLQQLLIAAFRPVHPTENLGHPISIRVDDDKVLRSVCLGGKPKNIENPPKTSRPRKRQRPA